MPQKLAGKRPEHGESWQFARTGPMKGKKPSGKSQPAESARSGTDKKSCTRAPTQSPEGCCVFLKSEPWHPCHFERWQGARPALPQNLVSSRQSQFSLVKE